MHKEIISKISALSSGNELYYGENPHQKGFFLGELSEYFEILSGKNFSYTNLLDIDAGMRIMAEFSEPTFAVFKHTNACGIASRSTIREAWEAALNLDPVSAYGGILISNRLIDKVVAEEIHELFFVLILAPGFTEDALAILRQKPNRRIVLQKKQLPLQTHEFRWILNGLLVQETDLLTEKPQDLKVVTKLHPKPSEIEDLLFAMKVAKHTRTSAVALVKNKQLIASGINQTSRVDSIREAISRAESYGIDLNGAVLASEAFLPFVDSVQIAHNAGIKVIGQTGGSIRDNDSIDFCNKHNMAMVFTGFRHFRY